MNEIYLLVASISTFDYEREQVIFTSKDRELCIRMGQYIESRVKNTRCYIQRCVVVDKVEDADKIVNDYCEDYE